MKLSVVVLKQRESVSTTQVIVDYGLSRIDKQILFIMC